MEFRIWELGIVMIGLGFLIVCINLAFTIKNVDNTVKKVELLVDDNLSEIGQIIGSVAGITTSVDTIFSQLRISDEVQMDIKLDSKSELFPIYKLVIDYEMGNWEEIDKDIKSLKILRNIPDIYIQAVKTTDDIVKFIKE